MRLRTGEDTELGKRTTSALDSGAGWTSQGKPKRRPPRRRIDPLSGSLGMEEYVAAEQSSEHTDGALTQSSKEVRSIRHDVTTARRGRDSQSLVMFLIPAIWEYFASEVTAVGVRNGADCFFRNYTASPPTKEPMIFSVSMNG